MTREEIIENNKLIAEFMGYVKDCSDKDFTFYTHPDGKGIVTQSHREHDRFISHGLMEARGFIFHRSWEWLMQVVEKIERLGYGTRMDYHRASMYGVTIFVIKRGLINAIIHVAKQDSRLTSVYLAVVEFIKWYNLCQKEK